MVDTTPESEDLVTRTLYPLSTSSSCVIASSVAVWLRTDAVTCAAVVRMCDGARRRIAWVRK